MVVIFQSHLGTIYRPVEVLNRVLFSIKLYFDRVLLKSNFVPVDIAEITKSKASSHLLLEVNHRESVV